MKKCAALLRRLFLALFLVFSLAFCVTRFDTASQLGKTLLLGTIGTGALYFLIALLSVIIKSAHSRGMEERDAMMDAYTSVLVYNKNSNMLNLFRRIAFWGTIMLPINIFALRVPFSMIYGGPYSTNTFLKGYHGFLLWSVIALVVLFILSIMFFKFFLPHYGTGVYTTGQYIVKMIGADFMTPIRVIKNFFSKSEDGKKPMLYVIDFIVMIAFIAINAVAIVMTLR